jgi:AcrR family transcriptional regulator
MNGSLAYRRSDIASVAGISEATFFRRWGAKAAIVAEALQDYTDSETPTPDTGSLQTNLVELLRGIITRIQLPTGLFFGLVEALIELAKDCGELPQQVNAHFLLEVAIGPILVRANATDQPFDDQFPEQIVALLLCGVRNTKEP